MVGLILGYYYYVSNKGSADDVEETTTQVTVVQQLLLKNISRDYPPTPKEVIKLYSDITVAFYTQEYTEEELQGLALKMRELYDPELVAANPEEVYLASLYGELNRFKEQGVSFSSYSIAAATDVEYFDKDDRKCAKLTATYTVKQGSSVGLTKEVFVLRKDDAGHWKILGWALDKE